jgi:hypothetical protein
MCDESGLYDQVAAQCFELLRAEYSKQLFDFGALRFRSLRSKEVGGSCDARVHESVS